MTDNIIIVLLLLVCILSLFGTMKYRKFAINNKILANLNFLIIGAGSAREI